MNRIWTAWFSEENKQKQEVVEHNICTRETGDLNLCCWEAGCHHGLYRFCTVLHVTFHAALNNETCKTLALGQDMMDQVWERHIWQPHVNGWQCRAHFCLSLDPSGFPKDTTAYYKPCTTRRDMHLLALQDGKNLSSSGLHFLWRCVLEHCNRLQFLILLDHTWSRVFKTFVYNSVAYVA